MADLIGRQKVIGLPNNLLLRRKPIGGQIDVLGQEEFMDRISNFSKKTWRDFIAENAKLRVEITKLQCEVRHLLWVEKAFLQLSRQHYEERVILNDTIDKLTAERDAAVAVLAERQACSTCKHYKLADIEEPCASCNRLRFGANECKWEWRGVKE